MEFDAVVLKQNILFGYIENQNFSEFENMQIPEPNISFDIGLKSFVVLTM